MRSEWTKLYRRCSHNGKLFHSPMLTLPKNIVELGCHGMLSVWHDSLHTVYKNLSLTIPQVPRTSAPDYVKLKGSACVYLLIGTTNVFPIKAVYAPSTVLCVRSPCPKTWNLWFCRRRDTICSIQKEAMERLGVIATPQSSTPIDLPNRRKACEMDKWHYCRTYILPCEHCSIWTISETNRIREVWKLKIRTKTSKTKRPLSMRGTTFQ